MKTPNYIFEKKSNTSFRLTLPKWSKQNKLKLLLLSDIHLDNKHCNQSLLKRHLQEAKSENALIICNGDTFCAMEGKWDKRRDQDALREELRGNNYLDKLVEYHANFWEPYADNLLYFGHGNHETSIEAHHQTNLIDRLVERLKLKNKNVQSAGYWSWLQIKLISCQTSINVTNLFAHHGCGGGAPVTKGLIDIARMQVFLPDADIIWIGHKHNEFEVTEARSRLSRAGVQYKDEQISFMTPGYKDEIDENTGRGWAQERFHPRPKPQGGRWLEFNYDRMTNGRVNVQSYFAK
tara:strand:- start:191 stop:1069 length:879 start_codon:yes stop_codon:yes gene_type:complete